MKLCKLIGHSWRTVHPREADFLGRRCTTCGQTEVFTRNASTRLAHWRAKRYERRAAQ